MRIWLLLVLLTLIRADLGKTQEVRGEIRGSLLALNGAPVPNARVYASEQKGKTIVESTTTAQDGSYRFGDLPAGTYNIEISGIKGFDPAEIRDVQIVKPGLVALPAVRVDWAFIDCRTEPRPNYYRPLAEAVETGAAGAIVTSETGGVIAKANVTLHMRGKGEISSQSTTNEGRFSFVGLQAGPEAYWVSISRAGYFDEDLTFQTFLPGFEAVYAPVIMEPCGPGRCRPELKRIRVLPTCL